VRPTVIFNWPIDAHSRCGVTIYQYQTSRFTDFCLLACINYSPYWTIYHSLSWQPRSNTLQTRKRENTQTILWVKNTHGIIWATRRWSQRNLQQKPCHASHHIVNMLLCICKLGLHYFSITVVTKTYLQIYIFLYRVLNSINCKICTEMQQLVYLTKVHNVDWPTVYHGWHGFERSIIDNVTDKGWRARTSSSVHSCQTKTFEYVHLIWLMEKVPSVLRQSEVYQLRRWKCYFVSSIKCPVCYLYSGVLIVIQKLPYVSGEIDLSIVISW